MILRGLHVMSSSLDDALVCFVCPTSTCFVLFCFDLSCVVVWEGRGDRVFLYWVYERDI